MVMVWTAGAVASLGSKLAETLQTFGVSTPGHALNVSMHAGCPVAIVPPGQSSSGLAGR